MATLTARLPVSGPTVAKTAYSRRYVIAAAASGRQGGTGGERAAGVSACNRRTAIGLGAIAATVAPLTQSTAYAAVDNVATLKSAYAAFGECVATKDTSKLLTFMADNITWTTNVNGGFETKNVAGVKRFFEWINDNMTVTSFVPAKFVAQGDEVVSLFEWTGTSKTTGKPFKAELVHFFTFDPNTGKMIRFKEVGDTKAMDVFGVPWYQG